MPFYLLLCPDHGRVEVEMSMPEAMHGQTPCPTQGCERTCGRDYRAMEIREDSGNNLYPAQGVWSDQLTPGGDPIFLATRRDHQEAMKRMGVRPWESGLPTQEQVKKEKAKTLKQKRKKAFLRKFNQARTIDLGGA